MRNFIGSFIGTAIALAGFWCVQEALNKSPPLDRSLMALKIPVDYAPCPDVPDVIRRMAFSLDTEPTVWSSDGYRAKREGGGAMWIANSDYGIDIGPSELKLRRIDDKESRQCLWAAYQRWVTNPKSFR